MKQAYNIYNDKVYLDQLPELHTAIKEYLTGLDLDYWGSGCENWLNETECRRRDGFIPHSHNHGGFDVYNTSRSEPDLEDESGDSDEIILHGFRVMYEGQENGIHTLCMYYCEFSEDGYFYFNNAPTLAEIEIRFKTTSGLLRQMKRFVNKTLKG
jgi:hypothetical protein